VIRTDLNNEIMIHTLPPLPYAADALEPKMSQETIGYHYGKHAKAYVDKLNSLIKDTPYESMSLEDIIVKADGAIFNNAAQVWNHVFFFNTLTPEPVKMPEDLEQAIADDFGSEENFKEEMKIATLSLFGSGWVWLAEDQEGRLHITSESNAGNPMKKGLKPLMAIDVWEHAYYIDHRNRRADFFESIWELTDWNIVGLRLKDKSAKDNDYIKTKESD
jgi:Fe-Mn family superoxide dismutase